MEARWNLVGGEMGPWDGGVQAWNIACMKPIIEKYRDGVVSQG